jgi:16S rRNA (cytidine1402-2'-O)-methyltransferase
MVMIREMTKVFEEIKRRPVSAILQYLTPDKIRGEFTLVVAGSEEETADDPDMKAVKIIEEMLAEKMSVKDIACVLSNQEGFTYRQIYKQCLARKKALRV